MMYLDEIFLSIQGESVDSGLPCVFIRLFGCPIGCTYCDQKQDPKNKKRISIENIISTLRREYFWCKNVCITGGEPLIYKDDVIPLTLELKQLGYKVSIETSGCIPIEDCGYRRSYKYVMDIKGPSSGVSKKNVYENLLHLQLNDEVKYVIKDRKDYEFMKDIMKKYPTSASILVSPMFDEHDCMIIGQSLVQWIIEDKLNVRVQIQLHKILEVK